jgi:hypothetical protein
MADGTDEDGAHAARMDEKVAWEAVEGAALRSAFSFVYLSLFHSFVRGARTPRIAHSAQPRAEAVVASPAKGQRLGLSFVFPRPWGWMALSRE